MGLGVWAHLAAVLFGVATLAPGALSSAPPDADQTPGRRDRIRQADARWDEAFSKGNLADAEAALRELIALEPGNFVHHYNLACVLSMTRRKDDAIASLKEAIAVGFSDLTQLKTDPSLFLLRDTPEFKAIVEAWDEILEARRLENVEALKKTFSREYRFVEDPALRLQFAAAYDEQTLARIRGSISTLATWWRACVDPTLPEAFDARTPWVVVILPTRSDYAVWAAKRFGPAWQQIGGSYSDDEKTLVAMDLGGTLRHEFWHVLHWRHMRRLGQMHPVWIMEGLCSLPEDVVGKPDGTFRPLPSWRTNMVKRLERSAGLTPFDTLMTTSQSKFVGNRPLANYAQARAVFMFMLDHGKLKDFYRIYTNDAQEGYAADPTGRRAIEAAFKAPLKTVERDFRAWVRLIDAAPEAPGPGDAWIPFEVEASSGDGLTIVSSFVPDKRRRSDPLAGRSLPGGLRKGDVITKVGGAPVHELAELVRVLTDSRPGDEVEVDFRRVREHMTAKIRLVPAE
jgi:hypothetical protein